MEFDKFTFFEPVHKKGKGRVCAVPNCDSIDDGSVTFHQFPKSGKKIVVKNPNGTIYYCDQRKVWEDFLGIDQKITYLSKVCSIHFNPDDFGNYYAKRRRLKATAVPTVNRPEESGAFLAFKNIPNTICQFKSVDCNHNIKKNTVQFQRAQQTCDNVSAINREVVEESQGVVHSAPKLCDKLDIKDSAEHLCENAANIAIKPEVIKEECGDESAKCELDVIKDEYGDESIKFELNSAIYNDQILDMLLMHTKFEIENLASSGDLDAINYNSKSCS